MPSSIISGCRKAIYASSGDDVSCTLMPAEWTLFFSPRLCPSPGSPPPARKVRGCPRAQGFSAAVFMEASSSRAIKLAICTPARPQRAGHRLAPWVFGTSCWDHRLPAVWDLGPVVGDQLKTPFGTMGVWDRFWVEGGTVATPAPSHKPI